MRMLNSACAACTRLLKDCCARDRPDAADSADPGPCGPPKSCAPLPLVAAAPLCAIVAPAAMVAAAAPTCDKNARRLEPLLRRVSSVAFTRKSSSTWVGRFDSDIRSSVGSAWNVGLVVVDEPTWDQRSQTLSLGTDLVLVVSPYAPNPISQSIERQEPGQCSTPGAAPFAVKDAEFLPRPRQPLSFRRDSMPQPAICYNFVLPVQRLGRPYDFTLRQKRAGTYTSRKAESFGQQDQSRVVRNRRQHLSGREKNRCIAAQTARNGAAFRRPRRPHHKRNPRIRPRKARTQRPFGCHSGEARNQSSHR